MSASRPGGFGWDDPIDICQRKPTAADKLESIRNRWNNIPSELKALPNWVYWRLETRDGKPTKVPKNAKTGFNASTTDPSTWSTFDQAVRTAVNGTGIGFVFTTKAGYVGIDLDHYINMDVLTDFDTYAERSQSGAGCHIILKGKLPEYMGGGKRKGDVEAYSTGRYFVMTGDVLLDRPAVPLRFMDMGAFFSLA